MLATYSRNTRIKTAELENAFNVEETEILNGVSELSFKIPTTDPKRIYCKAFEHVKWGELSAIYRLLDIDKETNETQDFVTYKCEHVIATLIDDVIFGTAQIDNLTTRQSIEYILNKQTVKRWVLGDCEFDRRFSYSWSNENLLSALYSIPNRFDIGYKWEFDTSNYPWKIHLRVLNEKIPPEFYVRKGKNLLAEYLTTKNSNFCTRLYALGYGEGINQLTFSRINGGKPYIDAPVSVISEYGLISRIWEDARFEIAENLLERAKVLLHGLSKPYETYSISVADLEELSGDKMDRAEAGKIISFEGYITFITRVVRKLDDVGPYKIDIANQPEDIAGSIADLADRQRISSVYAQGATCLYSQAFNDNADETHPATIKFYVPSEARNINKVILTWELERFRGYTKSAASGGGTTRSTSAGGRTTRTSSAGGASTNTSSSGGASTNTSSSGGGGTSTSSSGGGTSKSTASGGGTATSTATGGGSAVTSGASSSTTTSTSTSYDGQTSANYNISGTDTLQTTEVQGHRHLLNLRDHAHTFNVKGHSHSMPHTHTVGVPSHNHSFEVPSHSHDFNVPAHVHNVTIPAHEHSVSIGNHTHTVNTRDHVHTLDIPDHMHSVTLEDHTHNMVYGIYEGSRANTVTIKVDGKLVYVPSNIKEVDVASYLNIDGSGKIRRGSFHTIEIIPDTLTRITATLSVQLFIQSEGGGIY